MKINTVVIDNDILAIDVLAKFLQTIETIELMATFTNPVEGMGFVNNNKVDLIFIAVEMPIITGLEFIDALKEKPNFIFTCCCALYAAEAFEAGATDYLIKPFSYQRFLKAINKLKNQNFIVTNTNNLPLATLASPFIFVKSDYESIKIIVDDIIYIDGLKDYLKIHLTDNRYILTLSNFKNLLDKLPCDSFVRVHNSYAINLKHVEKIQKNRVITGNKRIPISATYKDLFFQKIRL